MDFNFEEYYEKCSFEELVDIFTEIDDENYTDRALNILSILARHLNVEPTKIQMEQLVSIPTTVHSKDAFYLSHNPSNFIDEVYTDEGVEVRDKLIRLKKNLNKT